MKTRSFAITLFTKDCNGKTPEYFFLEAGVV
uniref:Uncharacterized protein n=1 Tax=Anguilla anguilla TaxID=7936 RepID=A0A0E9W8F8_ANGAN